MNEPPDATPQAEAKPDAKRPAPKTDSKVEKMAPVLATLGPVARSSVVDAVADRIRGEILAGRLAAGSRMPSERELSVALGVNRLTLRAALARLEAVGLVATRHGAGTVVAPWRERAGLDALPSLIVSLQADDAERRELVLSLLELRRIVAAEAIALAAERRTREDLGVMTALAAEQPPRVGDPLAFARGDVAFVRAIVRATRNVALELVLNTFARFPDDHPELVAEMFDTPDVSIQYYTVVIELIRRGDPQLARELVRRELDRMDEAWAQRHPVRAPARQPRPTGTPRLPDSRVADSRVADSRVADSRVADSRTPDSRVADPRQNGPRLTRPLSEAGRGKKGRK